MENNCVFCSIIEGKVQANKLYEDEDMIIIKDMHPRAALHYLMIPKSHYKLIDEMTDSDAEQFLRCMRKLPGLAPNLGLENGYRLIINQGGDGGQTVFHLHVHMLGGEALKDF